MRASLANRVQVLLPLLALLLPPLLGVGCDWPWPLTNPDDPARCDPACAGGTRCIEGRCVWMDASAPLDSSPLDSAPRPDHLPGLDRSKDGPFLDAPGMDIALPDTAAQDLANTDGPPPLGKWVLIKAGTFKMGSPANGLCHQNDETLHPVTITRDFLILSTEVTQAMFLSAMGANPAINKGCGGGCPVENVNWHQAAAYCSKLSKQQSLTPCYTCSGAWPTISCVEAGSYSKGDIYKCPGFRLPTEAEWEYAYRAGGQQAFYTTATCNGLISTCTGKDPNAGRIGWYKEITTTTKPAAKLQPNAWGLYDMAGNVWEWCHDRLQADLGKNLAVDPWGSATSAERVFRGGAYNSPALYLRAAYRTHNKPAYGFGHNGFRCVRTAKP